MATLIATATGNLTTSTTWGLAAFESLAISGTYVTTSPLDSDSFDGADTTVDGVLLQLYDRAASPSGTLTVTIRNVTGGSDVVSVTVDIADLPALSAPDGLDDTTARGVPIFFKFGSTPTLSSGTDYAVRLVSSASTQVRFMTNDGVDNWGHALRTTTTQAPSAGDNMIISAELTGQGTGNSLAVTQNNNDTTDFGWLRIGGGANFTGKLLLPTESSSQLRMSGSLCIRAGGHLDTDDGGDIVAGNTCIIEFDCASDAQFGFEVGGLATVNWTHAHPANTWALLASDASATDTSLTVDRSVADWPNGANIVVASTSQDETEAEQVALTAGGSGTTLTSESLSNAHDGTDCQAEVILLDRESKLRSTSTTNLGYWKVLGQGATLTLEGVELKDMTTEVQGVMDNSYAPTLVLNASSMWNVGDAGVVRVYLRGDITINDLVAWHFTDTTSQLWFDLDGNTTVSGGGWIIIGFGGAPYGVFCDSASNVLFDSFTDLRISGLGSGFSMNTSAGQISGSLGLFSHSHVLYGAELYRVNEVAFTKLHTKRNDYGLQSEGGGATINEFVSTGNNLRAMRADGGTYSGNDWTLDGDSDDTTAYGIEIASGTLELDVANLQLGQSVGFSAADYLLSGPLKAVFYDSNFGTLPSLPDGSSVRSSAHGGTVGNYAAYYPHGTITRDATVFNTSAPSEKLTPSDAVIKLESAQKHVHVESSTAPTVTVYVREDASYNGNRARLILKANPGVTYSSGTPLDTDVILDTATAASDEAWEQLSGDVATTLGGTIDGNVTLDFVVDCDGTAGVINVDDWELA